MDTLFGEGQTGPKILLFLVVVLGLLALAFWLLRRFGGGRLGSSATRGRQPRLAMIDQAAIDNRRRLILIRRDNVEHLLIIGGPTDVVIEQNIVRAAGATLAPGRPATATDTLPRAVPLGEDTMWPLQPEPAPKPDATPRVEPALRTESAPRPQRPPTGVEEPIHWPGESEPPVTAAPDEAPPRERKPRPLDPLAGIRAGVLRTIDERPAWHAEQALTVEQALEATCVTPAWLCGDERLRGKLLPGFVADCVVLSTDPVEDLGGCDVVATMAGGRWVHNPPPW